MRIAQLTDPHVVAKGTLLQGTIDSGGRLREAIAFVNSMEPRVDALLLTGDLVETPTDDAFDALVEIVDTARPPVYLIAGNHDSRAGLTRAFGGTPLYPVADGFIQYCVDDFPVRLIGLDSVLEGSDMPIFDDDRARWLDHVLTEEPKKPTLIIIHHPPFRTGVAFVDLAPADWPQRLARLVKKHAQVKLIVSGHAHTCLSGQLAGTPAYVAPSTAFQLVSRLGVDEAPIRIDEPAPVTLHYWDGHEFVTTTCASHVEGDGNRIDRLSGVSWDKLKAAMQSAR